MASGSAFGFLRPVPPWRVGSGSGSWRFSVRGWYLGPGPHRVVARPPARAAEGRGPKSVRGFSRSAWKRQEAAVCCSILRSGGRSRGAEEAPGARRTCGLGLTTPPRSAPRVMSSTEAKLIYQKYDEMMALLRGYREKTFQDWVAGVDQDCHFNLGQPLIQRDHVTKLIRVNFSKAVGVSGRRPERRPPGPWARWRSG